MTDRRNEFCGRAIKLSLRQIRDPRSFLLLGREEGRDGIAPRYGNLSSALTR